MINQTEKQTKTIDLKEIIQKISIEPKRQDGESFKNYKKRRKNNNYLINIYLKGSVFYYCDLLTEHNIDIDTNTAIPYRNSKRLNLNKSQKRLIKKKKHNLFKK